MGSALTAVVMFALLASPQVFAQGTSAPATPGGSAAAAPQSPPIELLRHALDAEGSVLESSGADRLVNPASIVKLATSLWAIERLGPSHRFTTRLLASGPIESSTGTLQGDLVVQGGGDPDFHLENGFLLAAALQERGVRKVSGRIFVTDGFWMGWEHGKGEETEALTNRPRRMAMRLRDVLDRRRWDKEIIAAWSEYAARSGLSRPPWPIEIEGGLGTPGEEIGGSVLLEHASRPLIDILRRFNAWSNNDISRLSFTLGSPAELTAFLRERWGDDAAGLDLQTLSGLGTNRMTPLQVTRLLKDLRGTLGRLGLGAADLLPAAGCGPGTLESFAALVPEGLAGSVVAKTGTLIETDGGVVALAGFARTAKGEITFVVAAPGSGQRVYEARRSEAAWVADLLARSGGAVASACGAHPGTSDQGATVTP